ncbi:MAG: thiamine phosphate synthase, partial [Bacteroidaceae bacterium]|nr:thiamine phosphate synthase [Bacteroidaceae bacterium]
SADYIGCGPFRFTETKQNLAPTLGLDGYRTIVHHLDEELIRVPIVAIGGITVEDIDAIMATGVSGIALSGTILQAEHPVSAMQDIVVKMNDINI